MPIVAVMIPGYGEVAAELLIPSPDPPLPPIPELPPIAELPIPAAADPSEPDEVPADPVAFGCGSVSQFQYSANQPCLSSRE